MESTRQQDARWLMEPGAKGLGDSDGIGQQIEKVPEGRFVDPICLMRRLSHWISQLYD